MSGLSRYIKEALSNFRTSKLRSFLAILGILVGTGSVVALISSSLLATEHALAQFKTLGTNLIAMSITDDQNYSSDQKKQFQIKDLATINRAVPDVTLIAPYTSLYQTINIKGKSIPVGVIGATPSMVSMVGLKIKKGRFVSPLDRQAFYCTIGYDVAHKLKMAGVFSIIGSQITVGTVECTIVGIMNEWQENLFMYADLNNSIIVPLSASYLMSSGVSITNVLFRFNKQKKLKNVQDQINSSMVQILPHKKFYYRTPQEIIKIVAKQSETFTWLLGMIGGIALLVGGIGVMNIMLVSVIERKREIGIRMAIGAKQRDIRMMFLTEAITLTMFGGIFGVAVGTIISAILAFVAHWGFHFFITPTALGFFVSVIVGIISGYYPARKAAQLNPIECLRSE